MKDALMTSNVRKAFRSMVGLNCTLLRIPKDRSLFVAFGELDESGSVPHGKWEFGTYVSAWRILKGGIVVLGSTDYLDNFDRVVAEINSGVLRAFVAVDVISPYDVRLVLSDGLVVEVFCTFRGDEEVAQVFMPSEDVATFFAAKGWEMHDRNKPLG